MSPLETLLHTKRAWLRVLAAQLTTAQDVVSRVDDLVQESALALVPYLAHYDPTRGATLWTYAEPRARGAMWEAKRTLDPVPRSVRLQARTTQQVIDRLRQQYGRDPEGDEIAQALDISLDTYEQWRAALACLAPLQHLEYVYSFPENGPEQAGVYATLHTFLADRAPNPAVQAEHAQDEQHRGAVLTGALARLTVHEQQVVRLRYWDDLTFKTIGTQLGLTESGAWHLHHVALVKLRRWLTQDADGGTVAVQWPGRSLSPSRTTEA